MAPGATCGRPGFRCLFSTHAQVLRQGKHESQYARLLLEMNGRTAPMVIPGRGLNCTDVTVVSITNPNHPSLGFSHA